MGRGCYDHTGIAHNEPAYIAATHPPCYAMTAVAAPVQYTPVNVAAPVPYGPVYPPMVAQQGMVQQYHQTVAAPMAPAQKYQMYQQSQMPLIQQPQIQQQPLQQQQQQIQQVNANPYFYTSMAPGTINPQLLCNGGSFNGQTMYQIAPSGGIQGGVAGPQGK